MVKTISQGGEFWKQSLYSRGLIKTSARLSDSGDVEKKKVKGKYDARDLEKGCGRLWREKRERRLLSLASALFSRS